MRARSVAILAALLAVPAAESQAQTLWYNGDPDGETGIASQISTGSTAFSAFLYDNFLVGGEAWHVTGLVGNFLGDEGSLPATAFWEIRSGMSDGDGGSLLFSGENSLSWIANGFDQGGRLGFHAVVSGFAPFSLGAGTYWVGIAPVWPFSPGGQTFVWTTSGANGVNPLLDGHHNLDFPFLGVNYQADYNGSTDFSYGVLGTAESVVPEPSTVLLLGSGLAGMGLVTWRRRRTK